MVKIILQNDHIFLNMNFLILKIRRVSIIEVCYIFLQLKKIDLSQLAHHTL